MVTYENQKTITTKAAEHANTKTGIYGMFNVEAMFEAMALLSDKGFKVWCYMAKNQNNQTFALSCEDVCEKCKMTKPTYLKCVQELIQSGYLVVTSSNHFDFYEKLPEEEEMEVTVKKADTPAEFTL